MYLGENYYEFMFNIEMIYNYLNTFTKKLLVNSYSTNSSQI